MNWAVFLLRPRPLGFVEYDDVIVRRRSVLNRCIPEMMNILNECLNGISQPTLGCLLAIHLLAYHFVAKQRFSQDGDKRAVP